MDPHPPAVVITVVAGLVFAAAAATHWSAVAVPAERTDRRLVAVSKLMATAALLVIAASGGAMAADARAALVVAVVCCFAGDAFLVSPTETRFVAGLASFACGHLAYVVTALLVGVDPLRMLVAVPFLVGLFGFRFATRIVPGAARRGGAVLRNAVVFYAVVIAAMVLAATGTPSWLAALGAMTFAVSDWMIGYDRFVRPFRHARLAVMVTYHVGQILLIVGVIAGG